MPRRERPPITQRSEHWLRVAVNECSGNLDFLVSRLYNWGSTEKIQWLSPIASDGYAEYFDQEFLEMLGVSELKVPLSNFWPKGGPRWDGFGKTCSGKIILVEAKAYIEEGVDYRSKAGPTSFLKILQVLASAKQAFGAPDYVPWESPFYQYANRIAHLYFLRQLNALDAYLMFLYFADAPDVPNPCTTEQWRGAIRLTDKCLGLGAHRFRNYVRTLIWSVPDMIADKRQTPSMPSANPSWR